MPQKKAPFLKILMKKSIWPFWTIWTISYHMSTITMVLNCYIDSFQKFYECTFFWDTMWNHNFMKSLAINRVWRPYLKIGRIQICWIRSKRKRFPGFFRLKNSMDSQLIHHRSRIKCSVATQKKKKDASIEKFTRCGSYCKMPPIALKEGPQILTRIN